MVPAKLALRNFLCYRDCPPLDLEGVHVACLTGDNGYGKSALLDAITWALWGKARSSHGADLVSLGATDMEVEFEFYAGEARYRVLRKWRRTGARSGTPGLELQVQDSAGWRALTGSTIAETERAIEQLLKLSYDAFINSSFLVQGKSGLFTSKSAGQRKAVLAEILDLGRYDGWEARARALLREANQRVTRTSDAIATAEREISALEDRPGELIQLQDGVDALSEQYTGAQHELERLQSAAQERHRLGELLAEARRAAIAAANRLAEAQAGIDAQTPALAQFEAILARAEAVESGYAELSAARAQEQEQHTEHRRLTSQSEAARQEAARLADERTTLLRRLAEVEREHDGHLRQLAEAGRIRAQYALLEDARRVLNEQAPLAQRVAALEQQQSRLAAAIDREQARLQQRQEALERERGEIAARAERVPALEAQHAALQGDDASVLALRRSIHDAQQEEAERREEQGALRAENQRLLDEMKLLAARRDELLKLEEAGTGDCPLCRTRLDGDGIRRVVADYDAQGSGLAGRHRANRARLPELEAQAQTAAERVRRQTAELERRTGERRQVLGQVVAELREARQAATRLAALDPERVAVAAALAGPAFCPAERAEMARLTQERAGLPHDPQAYRAALAQVEQLAGAQPAYEALAQAEARQAAAARLLAGLGEQRHDVEERLQQARQRAGAFQAAASALPLAALAARVAELAPHEDAHRRLQQARGGIDPARAALSSHQANAARAAAERAEAEQRAQRAGQELASLPETDAALPDCRARVADLRERLHQLQQELGKVKGEVQRLTELQQRRREHGRQLVEEQRQAGIYDELVQAFGKHGVQGLLIETVLPEIEEAANELLSRMTNNRMHLTLDTQRLTQKGETVETMEVRIADEWGTRPYELFSGGEAFRIDLALRIALSKLLARRAGAPLATLVIDEGFGTQDAAGRERLIEAITAIQDHFQCLLVVTHISELKDLFDTRIEVSKSGDGSIARVVAG